ncbi:MAG: DUF2071 domain-containing protein [Akkermansiaceae bacterium]
MKIPTITGVIRRRVLLNYRIDPEITASILPRNFRPQLVNGYAIAGICLIRLEQVRPKGMPALVGFSSENSAHRIGVEWDAAGIKKYGVYVPRRDTDCMFNALVGGRLFPGAHELSAFEVSDKNGNISMQVTAKDYGMPLVDFDAEESERLPDNSIFSSLAESSAFFEAGCIGYSPKPNSCHMEGLQLRTQKWKVSPLKVSSIRSAYFDDREIFRKEAIQFDHALLMRDIPHEWHSEPTMEKI